MTAYQPFPVDALPEPLRRFVATAAEAIGCDPAYVALPALAGVASAIGNARRIELKRGWTEPAVVWAAIVGESGTLKSPALEAPLKAIRDRQADALKAHGEAMKRFQADHVGFEADLAAWKRTGRKNGERPPEPPEQPTCERLWVSDVTVEALAERLSDAPRGLLLKRDELAGWLKGFDQYRGGKGGDAAHWLSMHGARELLVDRKSGDKTTIYVRNAAVSITGGIQPETLRRALDREHFEDGLAARLLVAMPPRVPKTWTEVEIPADVDAALAFIFDRLRSLQPERDGNDEPRPVALKLSPAGKAAWIEFFNEHAHEQAELTGDLAAAWSKLEGYAARLALLVHLVRWANEDPDLESPDAVDAASIASGVTLSRWFGQEARRVYAALSESDEARDRRQLVELIERKGGRISARDLMRASRQYRGDAETAEHALHDLVRAGIGRWTHYDHDGQGGRPGSAFELIQPVRR